MNSNNEIINEFEKAMDKKLIFFKGRKQLIIKFINKKQLEIQTIRDNFKSKVIKILFLIFCNKI
jgi:hypothetical protein